MNEQFGSETLATAELLNEGAVSRVLKDLWPAPDTESGEALRQVAALGRDLQAMIAEDPAVTGIKIGVNPQIRIYGASAGGKLTLEAPDLGNTTLQYDAGSQQGVRLFQNGKEVPAEDLEALAVELAESLQSINLDAVTLDRD